MPARGTQSTGQVDVATLGPGPDLHGIMEAPRLASDRPTELSATIACKPLQTVPRRDPEVLDVLRRMDQFELPQSRPLDRAIEALDVLLMPDALGVLAPERPDHEPSA